MMMQEARAERDAAGPRRRPGGGRLARLLLGGDRQYARIMAGYDQEALRARHARQRQEAAARARRENEENKQLLAEGLALHRDLALEVAPRRVRRYVGQRTGVTSAPTPATP